MTLIGPEIGREPDDVPVRTLSELTSRHGLELLRFAYLISGDRSRAEDLLQDVLLAMYRRFGESLPVDNPRAYARRAVVNANVSWARRRMNAEVAVDAVPEAPAAGSGPDPAERDALWQALRRLPERQRTVLVLRFYADAPDSEIAALLECRPGTVRSLASRGLDALRGDPTLYDGPAARTLDLEGGAR